VLSHRSQVRRSFSNAANSYVSVASHQKRVAEKLVSYYKMFYLSENEGDVVLDLGSGTGFVSDACSEKKLFKQIINLDISEAMLHNSQAINKTNKKICADLQSLPFKNSSIELCLSSYAFQWAHCIEKLFSELYRVLKPGGMLFFSIPGPETFNELKNAWLDVDDAVHVHDFCNDKEILNTAFSHGFKALHYNQVYDVLEYGDQKSALQHIKKIGAHNLDEGREKSLLGKQRYLDFSKAFQKYSNSTTECTLSYESYFIGLQKPFMEPV
jgi:malonyl-CoA O-methyltransferase